MEWTGSHVRISEGLTLPSYAGYVKVASFFFPLFQATPGQFKVSMHDLLQLWNLSAKPPGWVDLLVL